MTYKQKLRNAIDKATLRELTKAEFVTFGKAIAARKRVERILARVSNQPLTGDVKPYAEILRDSDIALSKANQPVAKRGSRSKPVKPKVSLDRLTKLAENGEPLAKMEDTKQADICRLNFLAKIGIPVDELREEFGEVLASVGFDNGNATNDTATTQMANRKRLAD